MSNLQLFAEISSLPSNLREQVSVFVKSLRDRSPKIFEEPQATYKSNLTTFLLQGPVFSEDQINKIKETSNSINEWRTK